MENGKNIDFVIAYVDNTDKVWQKNYVEYCQSHNKRIKIADLHSARYEDIGLINYQLKLVEKNLPFVNRIYLLLSNKEQAPKNLSDKVQVVLHEDFIPLRYLPTFNSTTIEMFLWNIPNLGEYFIYANDDMIPTKPMCESDFFENDKVKINFKDNALKFTNRNEFPYQCWNSLKNVSLALDVPFKDTCEIMRPFHSFTPMIKSHCIECYNALKSKILPNIGAFRSIYQHNQYIYPLWEHLKYGTLPTTIDFDYTEMEIEKGIDFDHQIVCINIIRDESKIKAIKEGLQRLCEL